MAQAGQAQAQAGQAQAQAGQAHVQASSFAFVNGQLIRVDDINANYDGKHLAIDINENGRHFNKVLNNKDIERMLAKPAHKLALEDRLQRDFLGTRKKSKTVKKKSMAKRRRRMTKRR